MRYHDYSESERELLNLDGRDARPIAVPTDQRVRFNETEPKVQGDLEGPSFSRGLGKNAPVLPGYDGAPIGTHIILMPSVKHCSVLQRTTLRLRSINTSTLCLTVTQKILTNTVHPDVPSYRQPCSQIVQVSRVLLRVVVNTPAFNSLFNM